MKVRDMTNIMRIPKCLCAVTLGLAGVCSTGMLVAQDYGTNIVVETFNDSFSLLNLGGVSGSYNNVDWDADGNPGGSLLVDANWVDLGNPYGWQEIQISYPWESVNPDAWYGFSIAPYYTIEFDVKVLGNPALGALGDYGEAQLVLQGWAGNGYNDGGANWATQGLIPLTTTNEWRHISYRLTSFARYNLNNIVINFVGRGCSNSISYLVDNLEIKLPTGPPPTLTFEKPPASGLHLVMGSGYARQNIRTVGTNFAWVGAGGPVSYSLTIKEYPSITTATNFQTHIFLVPNDTNSTPVSDPDWEEPTVARLDIYSVNGITNAGWVDPDVVATAVFRYKTNSPPPNGNGNFYPPQGQLLGNGTIGFLPIKTSILGTWTVTFNSDTNVTLSGPDGSSTNFVFADAGFFASDSLRVFYGVQAPSDSSQDGLEAVLSGVAITGAGGGLSDDFSGANLDTSKWQIAASSSANVYQVVAGVAYNLSWQLPDNLFKLANSPDLTNLTNSSLNVAVSGTTRSVAIPPGYPSPDQGFFALIKRPYTQLQVLLPGETAAPGTATGKTGTPIAQTAGARFQVTINAVDSHFSPAFCVDQMYLKGSDTNTFGYVWKPQLISGANTMYWVTNTAAGSGFTISVGDNDNTNISEAASSPYSVN